VGFPEESDEEFLDTCKFVQKVKFSQLHIFPYSKREGTVASKLYKDMSGDVKSKRVARLDKIGEKLKRKFIKKSKFANVLIEEKIDGYFVGYSENYIRVYIDENSTQKDLTNEIVEVRLKKLFKDGALGKLK